MRKNSFDRIKFKKAAFETMLAVLSIIILLPIIFTIIYSFTSPGEIVNYMEGLNDANADFIKVKIIPDLLSIRQYYDVLLEKQQYLRYFINSTWYSIAIVAGQLLVAPLAAYCFSKFKFKFREMMFFIYIVIMMMPFQVVMIPNYIALKQMGLFNTAGAVILPSIFAPFAVFLLRQYMLSVPDEIIEASRIDGAGPLRVLLHIMIPMVAPGIAAMAVLSFADVWNMVEQPLLFLTDFTKYPLSLALSRLESFNLTEIFAGSVLFIVPIIILFLIFNDDIQSGIEKFKF